MKKIIGIFFLYCFVMSVGVSAQQEKKKLYNPDADAGLAIATAVQKAKAERKHVFLQIGGNWCMWCLRFNELINSNDTLRNYMQKNYEIVHVNYSKENKNEQVLASLGYPQRFGFPVFVILDNKGNRIHTQNSAYLEEGKGHGPQKVLEFLKNWSPQALDPTSYK